MFNTLVLTKSVDIAPLTKIGRKQIMKMTMKNMKMMKNLMMIMNNEC
jgi:hypothetical protein